METELVASSNFDIDYFDVRVAVQAEEVLLSQANPVGVRNAWASAARVLSKIGQNRILTEGVVKLSRKNDILVVGPPRAGKSQLIKAITGDESIRVAPTFASVTKDIVPYETELFTFWDTPGIESWSAKAAKEHFHDIFISRQVLPLGMFFCCAPGSFINFGSQGFQQFKDLAIEYGVPMFFILCNCCSASRQVFDSVPVEICHIIGASGCSVINLTCYRFHTEFPAYMSYVNSTPFESSLGGVAPVFGVTELVNQLLNSQDPETKVQLLKFHSNNQAWTRKLGAFAFDVLYTLGVPIDDSLTPEEKEAYKMIAASSQKATTVETIIRTQRPRPVYG